MKHDLNTYVIPAMLLAVVMLAACTSSGGKTPTKQNPVTVKIKTVSDTAELKTDSYVGEVKASKSAVISTRHGGTLVSLRVSQGDKVAKGQMIAEIDSRTVQTSYDMALATLRQAEDGYERVSKVYESGSVADVKMVEIETQLSKAQAAMSAARQALEDCTIKAPFAGTVSDVYVEPGVEVSLAEPVVRIVDATDVEISIPVPEAELRSVTVGGRALMDVPALGLKGVDVCVVSKGVVASPLSHTYDCRLHLLEKADDLMPGMVCKVYMDSFLPDAVIIPASVIGTDAVGRYVWTVGADDEVLKKRIDVGGFAGDGVVVTGGLKNGDRLIVEGAYKVSSGMKVKTMER